MSSNQDPSAGTKPDGQKKCLDTTRLQVGDIILVTANTLVSAGIRVVTRSVISHAMIYVAPYSVIDATDEGIQARNTQRLFYDADCAVHAVRLKRPLTSPESAGICTHARAAVGTQYSKREAMKAVLPGKKHRSRKQFCSRLAAQAYASVGIKLVSAPDYCSPENLLKSHEVRNLGEVTELISAEEASRWQAVPDLTAEMRRATNAVLDGARRLSPKIQTFDDLDTFLLAHPDQDSAIAELYRTAGYLDLWWMETDHHPWRYDLKLMITLQARSSDLDRYCMATLEGELVGVDQLINNREGYRRYVTTYGLTTFKILLDLYTTLVDLHQKRVEVAKAWLARPTRTEVLFPTVLAPHSEAWFEALKARNPIQAAAAKLILDMAGSDDVCSICGDDPACDYRLDHPFEAESRLTLKLCDECREIRAADGDAFVPI